MQRAVFPLLLPRGELLLHEGLAALETKTVHDMRAASPSRVTCHVIEGNEQMWWHPAPPLCVLAQVIHVFQLIWLIAMALHGNTTTPSLVQLRGSPTMV
jgi:hypothetical protein